MIHVTADSRIYIATQPADFRCGIDGFSALCRKRLEQDPRSGSLFVFTNRNRTMIKVLGYDGSGFWLMTKRLSQGHFKEWPKHQTALSHLTAKQFRRLLGGLSGWQKV